jgi:hypothetical protein
MLDNVRESDLECACFSNIDLKRFDGIPKLAKIRTVREEEVR